MNRKEQRDLVYMNIAKEISTLSHAIRKKVGCVIVKDKQIISTGYNGTPTGMSDVCEDLNGNTVPYVLHAESNALTKLAKSTNSSDNSILYVTLSPCLECAKLIIQSGINTVKYCEEYRDITGLEFLKSNNINVEKIDGN